MTESPHLATRATAIELVRVYQESIATVRSSFGKLHAAEVALNAAFVLGGYGTISASRNGRDVDYARPDEVIDEIRKRCWRAIVERLEVRRFMSIERWEKLGKQIEQGDMPEITVESVVALTAGFRGHLHEMLEEAVAEVFEWLRPRNNKYKRNSELEVPARVVLSYVVEEGWSGRFRVQYHRQQNLIALENVFSALDGRGQIAKSHYSAIQNVIEAEGFTGTGETDYFRFRACKNRNLHIDFKRRDLLARFNQIAGGRRLRPSGDCARVA